MDSLSLATRRIVGVRDSNSIPRLLLSLLVLQTHLENVVLSIFSQQPYFDDKHLNCSVKSTTTEGCACNGPLSSCTSYLTFRSFPLTIPPSLPSPSSSPQTPPPSQPQTTSPTSPPSPPATCSSSPSTSPAPPYTPPPEPMVNSAAATTIIKTTPPYVIKMEGETYFTIANITYGGLTTYQAMIAQNPVDSRNLWVGLRLVAPLMCACPSTNQSAKGFRYIVSYVVKPGDNVYIIAKLFGADQQVVLDANELSYDLTIYPYNPILVPMKSPPTNLNLNPTTPSPPPPPPPPPTDGGGSSNKWVFIGVGIGAFLFIFVLSLFLFWFSFAIGFLEKLPLYRLSSETTNQLGMVSWPELRLPRAIQRPAARNCSLQMGLSLRSSL